MQLDYGTTIDLQGIVQVGKIALVVSLSALYFLFRWCFVRSILSACVCNAPSRMQIGVYGIYLRQKLLHVLLHQLCLMLCRI